MSSALRQTVNISTRQARSTAPSPQSSLPLISIREMARRFDTTLRTLRFYESRGLIKPRREGMSRLYDAEAEQRFRLIEEGRKLGFTLTEIAEMLGTSRSVNELRLTLDKVMDQIEHLESQRTQIDAAIASLRRRYYLMSEGEGTDDAS